MSNVNEFPVDFNVMGHPDPSLTPPSETRSSPPGGALTPGQLELKRQRDRARRDAKLSTRIQRVNSSSFVPSSLMALGGVSSPMSSISNYTTAPLVVTPAPSFLPSYSPTLQEQSQGTQAFASPYQQSL